MKFASCRWIALAWVFVGAAAAGQEFRIDTEIFVGKAKEPAETLTLFSSGLVYDFLLTEPQEVTLFDPLRGRFTLLDPGRKLRCGLATQEVLNYVLALETHAAQSKDTLFAFAANPQFTPAVEEFEEHGQKRTRLALTAGPLSYSAVAYHPERPEAVRAVRNFADWFARLNAMRGNLPPAARLVLNDDLAKRELVPLEITRTAGKSQAKSRHLMTWTLSGEDRKRIERVGNYLQEFQAVSFDDYRAAASKPAGTKAQQARR